MPGGLEQDEHARAKKLIASALPPNLPQWLDMMSVRFALSADKSVGFDLCAWRERAITNNLASWFVNAVVCEGSPREAIQAHLCTSGFGDATYELKLPPGEPGGKIALKFGTVIVAASEDGVRFAVHVDGRELWSLVETEHLSGGSGENTVWICRNGQAKRTS